jgi:hypothetical protein
VGHFETVLRSILTEVAKTDQHVSFLAVAVTREKMTQAGLMGIATGNHLRNTMIFSFAQLVLR